MTRDTLQARGIEITFEPHCGFITTLEVQDGGRSIAMLHKAPWIDSGEAMPPDAAPHLAGLAGDFFCAPFGDASADQAPAHGWPANANWQKLKTERAGAAVTASYGLERPAMGARLTKHLTLVDDHAFLYQRHAFDGGAGAFAAANHAMLDVRNGAALSFSDRLWFETPAQGLETDPQRGRAFLKYPAISRDPKRFPKADGGMADLTTYPFTARGEEFLLAIESPESPLGWAAVARHGTDDLFISLRNAAELPMTMLWHSNGGRDYAPWSSRHRGVLGIEEGISSGQCGWSNAQTPNPLREAGIRMMLELAPDQVTEVRHIIGCIAWRGGRVARIVAHGDGIAITGETGERREVHCDLRFLGLAG